MSLCVPPCVSAAAPLGVITPLRVSHCTCGGTRRSFRGMIDLLSYTTMDLHAAWPVAGCRSSSRLLGVCVASSSSNVMSGSRQLRGTHVPSSSLSEAVRVAAVPSSRCSEHRTRPGQLQAAERGAGGWLPWFSAPRRCTGKGLIDRADGHGRGFKGQPESRRSSTATSSTRSSRPRWAPSAARAAH